MANVVKTRTLEQFKTAKGITRLSVFRSKNDKLYATNQEGELIAWVAGDLDPKKDVLVHTMSNEDGEVWEFIANGTPRVEEFGL